MTKKVCICRTTLQADCPVHGCQAQAPSKKLDLLPCPFCGNKATFEEVKDSGGTVWWTVGCMLKVSEHDEDDGCAGYQLLKVFSRKSAAAAAWNKRAAPEPCPAPKDELIEELVQGVVRAWRLRYPRSSLNQIAAEFRDVLAKWSASPQPPPDEYEAVGHQFKFPSPWGGFVWCDDHWPRNGSSYVDSRVIYAKRHSETKEARPHVNERVPGCDCAGCSVI